MYLVLPKASGSVPSLYGSDCSILAHVHCNSSVSKNSQLSPKVFNRMWETNLYCARFYSKTESPKHSSLLLSTIITKTLISPLENKSYTSHLHFLWEYKLASGKCACIPQNKSEACGIQYSMVNLTQESVIQLTTIFLYLAIENTVAKTINTLYDDGKI